MSWTGFTLCLLAVAIFIVGRPARAIDILIVTESLPPYSDKHEGTITGMSTEVVQAVLNELGMQADIQVYSWTRAAILNLDFSGFKVAKINPSG